MNDGLPLIMTAGINWRIKTAAAIKENQPHDDVRHPCPLSLLTPPASPPEIPRYSDSQSGVLPTYLQPKDDDCGDGDTPRRPRYLDAGSYYWYILQDWQGSVVPY